jgi:hypothetical protein
MAVGLPIGTRNLKSGIQRNLKTQPIPIGPSQTVGVARDPGVAGGPGNVPLEAFGSSGIGSFGQTLQDIGASERELQIDRQTALVAAEEKRQLGAHKNTSSIALAAAENEWEGIRTNWAYTDEKTIAEGDKKFKEVFEKYASALDGTPLQDKYRADLLGKEFQQATAAAKEKYGAEITRDEGRGQTAIDKFIAQHGTAALDPELVQPDLEFLVNEATGNLPQANKNKLLRENLRKLAHRQLNQMTKAFGGVGAEGKKEIDDYLDRPYIQGLVGPEFITAAQTSQQAITKEKLEAGADAKKIKAEQEVIENRMKRFQDFTKDITDPETLAYKTAVFMMIEKGELEAPTLVGESQIVSRPSLTITPSKPVIKGPEKVTTAPFGDPKNQSLAIITPDTKETPTVIEPFALPPVEPVNPLYTGVDAATGLNVLSKFSHEEARRIGHLNIGLVENQAGGRVTTSGEQAFVRQTIEKTLEILANDSTQKLSVIQANNLAVASIPEDQRPKTFNYHEHGKRIWEGKDTRPAQTGIQHPVTQEGGAALTAELSAGAAKLDAHIQTLYNQGKISLSQATGWWSGLADFFGGTVGNIFDSAVSPKAQRARFQFAMLARDFIRLVTLSPRFAVKEQELLATIFSGPDAWLAPGQAEINIQELEKFLAERGPSVVEELSFPAENKDKNLLLRELKIMKSIQSRIDLFDLGDTGRYNSDQLIEAAQSGEMATWTDQEFLERTGKKRVQRPSAVAPAPAPAPAEEQAEVSTGKRDPLTLPSTPEILDFVQRFLKANPTIDLDIIRDLTNSKLFPETDLGDARRQAVKKEIKKRKAKKKTTKKK